MSRGKQISNILKLQSLESGPVYTAGATGTVEGQSLISPASIAFCLTPLPVSTMSAAFCNN
ncbi:MULTISPECIES: hypothetical protein [Bacillus]|uniref:hypothetical protein n=1 Tax=Bacillus TaxID=1386 RepID=UPI000493B694|nr:hypothetical protein [Bacillus subtilis]MBR0008543.1 hypothetical protein [Bacillus subtilis]MBU8593686.1 hypothetical protein [Bacillus subtilis]MBU8613786.1 hypothetical protein [Bacillus subtilis]MBU8710126.1 hypothetical protein [Bacillus subtilis]MBU8719757.1 hypothetical protein [Bacillus subtilis]